MNAPEAIQALLEQAAELGAARALARHPGAEPEVVPVKEAKIGYRVALRAIASGELPAYRTGRTTWIATEDLNDWILRQEHRVRLDEGADGPVPDAPDEIGELIEISRGRR